MIYGKNILQKNANEEGNLNRRNLVDYFKRYHNTILKKEGDDVSVFDAEAMADECIELTKDIDDDVPMCEPECFDPTYNPTLTSFYYSDLVKMGEKFGDERFKQIEGEEIKVNLGDEKKEEVKPIRKKIMDNDFYKHSDPLAQPIREPRY
jgi:hypothetical protein